MDNNHHNQSTLMFTWDFDQASKPCKQAGIFLIIMAVVIFFGYYLLSDWWSCKMDTFTLASMIAGGLFSFAIDIWILRRDKRLSDVFFLISAISIFIGAGLYELSDKALVVYAGKATDGHYELVEMQDQNHTMIWKSKQPSSPEIIVTSISGTPQWKLADQLQVEVQTGGIFGNSGYFKPSGLLREHLMN